MKPHPLPLAVLAGSDPEPSVLPESGAGLHPLRGSKSIYLEIEGRPLIDVLIERLRESGCFDPIFIAGPVREFGESRGGTRVIDTDGTFGDNMKAAVEHMVVECPGQNLAVSTCDILPDVEELHELMDDYYQHSPLDCWFPLILTPERTQQLGASAWKPKYRIPPKPGAEPVSFLPGHLIVVDPEAFRRWLIYRSFDLAYRTRNRPILLRLGTISSHLMAGLMWKDFKKLLRFQAPTLTYSVIYNGIMLGLGLRRGTISPDAMSDRLRPIYGRSEHRRRYPDRVARFPLMKALSLAKDIDTEE
ncbi:MAG: hypothetical protein WBI00_17500, partial [Thermoanaerobaculia bacterium]